MTPYAQLFKDPRWQKKRLELLEKAGWACASCYQESKELHVHHWYYLKGVKPWDYPIYAYVVLCSECHKKYTDLEKLLKLYFTWYPDPIGFMADTIRNEFIGNPCVQCKHCPYPDKKCLVKNQVGMTPDEVMECAFGVFHNE